MLARILVRLREGVLDPAGQAVCSSLNQLGFDSVQGVRIGKAIDVELDESDRAQAEAKLKEMGERLLANPVIEDFTVQLL